eukprot:472759-Pyramimonas_sp.AAC.1
MVVPEILTGRPQRQRQAGADCCFCLFGGPGHPRQLLPAGLDPRKVHQHRGSRFSSGASARRPPRTDCAS